MARRNFPARRKSIWANQSITTPVSLTNQGVVIMDMLAATESNYGVSAFAGITIGPIIGQVQIQATAETTPVASNGLVGLGIAVVDRDQSNVPDPLTDDFDWIWLYRSPSLFTSPADQPASAAWLLFPESASSIFINNRSMRKMKQNHLELVLIGQHNDGFAGNHEPAVTGYLRTLIKLP